MDTPRSLALTNIVSNYEMNSFSKSVGAILKMLNLLQKIDLRHVLSGHVNTLVDEETGSKLWGDFLIFYGFPLVVGVTLYVRGVILSDGALDVATNALAILAGLLFNLFVVLHSLSWPKITHPMKETGRRLAGQVYANIAYCILISLIALVALTISANSSSCGRARLIFSSVSVYLIVHFGLTMLMVLRRTYIIIQDDFSSKD